MELPVGDQVIEPRKSAVVLGTHCMILSSVSVNYRKLPAHGPASLELVGGNAHEHSWSRP